VELNMRGSSGDWDLSHTEIPDSPPDAALLQKLKLPARPADTRQKNAR
jgi:hypothetical protein